MNWDTDYQEYLHKKTPGALEKWRLTKATSSSVYLCSGLPPAYESFLHSVLTLAPEITLPDYPGYIKDFRSLLE